MDMCRKKQIKLRGLAVCSGLFITFTIFITIFTNTSLADLENQSQNDNTRSDSDSKDPIKYKRSSNEEFKDDERSFSPIWKLMNSEQKQQFISGYIQGWKDAARVTDIAISYIRSNPDKAIDSLQGVKQLYALGRLNPSLLTAEIDEFFADPANSSASLSRAITASKIRLQR